MVKIRPSYEFGWWKGLLLPQAYSYSIATVKMKTTEYGREG